jgi:hypothetical protein
MVQLLTESGGAARALGSVPDVEQEINLTEMLRFAIPSMLIDLL